MQVLLVDDHTLFRQGLTLLLAQLDPDLKCIEFESFESFQSSDYDSCDIVLLDFHLPGLSDFAALSAMREICLSAPIVILSSLDDPSLIRKTIDSGASGFIPKSSSPEILIAALRLVLAGGIYLPMHVLSNSGNVSNANSAESNLKRKLSGRQHDVLRLAVQGKANKIIAHELNISEATVKAHMSAAFRSLGVRNRTEAVFAFASKNI